MPETRICHACTTIADKPRHLDTGNDRPLFDAKFAARNQELPPHRALLTPNRARRSGKESPRRFCFCNVQPDIVVIHLSGPVCLDVHAGLSMRQSQARQVGVQYTPSCSSVQQILEHNSILVIEVREAARANARRRSRRGLGVLPAVVRSDRYEAFWISSIL